MLGVMKPVEDPPGFLVFPHDVQRTGVDIDSLFLASLDPLLKHLRRDVGRSVPCSHGQNSTGYGSV